MGKKVNTYLIKYGGHMFIWLSIGDRVGHNAKMHKYEADPMKLIRQFTTGSNLTT